MLYFFLCIWSKNQIFHYSRIALPRRQSDFITLFLAFCALHSNLCNYICQILLNFFKKNYLCEIIIYTTKNDEQLLLLSIKKVVVPKVNLISTQFQPPEVADSPRHGNANVRGSSSCYNPSSSDHQQPEPVIKKERQDDTRLFRNTRVS